MCSSDLAHPHVSQHNSKEGEVPTVGADYHYMGKEGEEGTVPMLALKDAPSKVIFDMVATAKGVNEYMVKRVVQCLDLLGHKRIILKSDQEPALVALLDEVKPRWGGDIIPERSIVQDSQGNGMIESGIRTVSGQIKTMKSSLEEHLGEIGSDHICIAWMVEHAAFLISMLGIGRDGKEPYKLLKGKSWSGVVYEFGEGVQFKPIKTKGRYKLDDKLRSGIFLGVGRKSGEYLLGTNTGVYKARDIYRRASGERWDRIFFDAMVGTPWNMVPQADAEVPEIPRAGPVAQDHPEAEDLDVVPRRPRTSKYGR